MNDAEIKIITKVAEVPRRRPYRNIYVIELKFKTPDINEYSRPILRNLDSKMRIE